VQWLEEGGLMLGPFPERSYESYRVAVSKGDLVCLYTDGITEAMNPAGELYGEERLASFLQQNGERSVQELRNRILDEVKSWRQGGVATDDVTFVLLRILAVTSEPS
jgi:sigma-B regulation protein RsbU (phosphoserine phosphatase)